MLRMMPIRVASIGSAVLLTCLVADTPRAAAVSDPVARYTAFAVNLGGPGPAAAGTVELVIDRWSTDGQRDRLLQVLFDQGPEKLLDTLSDLPRAGHIRTPDSIGYPLRFAHRQAGEDGGEVITLITDRYINFWEAYFRPRTIDYPFTVIDLRLNRNGEGEGKMSVATRITGDKHNRRIVLENYAAQPVLLQNVRRDD